METVNLLLPLTVALLLSFSPAAGIRCYICKGDDCSKQNSIEKDCGRNVKMCMSAVISVNGLSLHELMGCAEHKLCPKTGPQIASITHGVTSLAQIDCCNTTLCNKQIPPPPSNPPAGTKTCPNHNKEIRVKEIKCNKLETTCFKTGDSDSDLYGCASTKACADKVLLQNLLIFSAPSMGYELDIKPAKCEVKASAPLQCQVCIDPCCSRIISFSAPSGSKCVAARVKDSSGSITVRKAIASAPLCSLSLTKAFAVDETEVQLTCCDTDHCNSEVPEFQVSMTPEPVRPCHGPGCTDSLYEQLHLLVKGMSVLTKTCSTNSEVVQ